VAALAGAAIFAECAVAALALDWPNFAAGAQLAVAFAAEAGPAVA